MLGFPLTYHAVCYHAVTLVSPLAATCWFCPPVWETRQAPPRRDQYVQSFWFLFDLRSMYSHMVLPRPDQYVESFWFVLALTSTYSHVVLPA